MKKHATPCDLCGLPVPTKPFRATVADGERLFCCDGCKTIWLILNADADTPPADENDEARQRANK